MIRWYRAILGACVILIGTSPALAAGSLSTSARGVDGEHVSVQWTYYESAPVGHPEWIGYDLLRRPNGSCGEFLRLNGDPIPRPPGSHSLSYTDTPPIAGETFEYRVIFVDMDHNRVFLGPVNCDYCVTDAWASAPDQSGPLTLGTLVHVGGWLFVQPCANSCYASFYIDQPNPQLEAYAASGTPLRIWAEPYCGTVEGCGMTVDHFEPVTCGVTPTRHSSWGTLKILYR